MRTLDELKKDVEDPLIQKDAVFFRDVVGELLCMHGFFLQDDRYEYYFREKSEPKHAPPPGFINTDLNGFASARDLEVVEKAKAHYGDLIDSYAFHQLYWDGSKRMFSVVVLHTTLDDLRKNTSFSYKITSPVLFEGFSTRQISEMCEQEPYADVEDILNRAFEKGFIGKGFDVLDDSSVHFYTPQILYKLLNSEDS